jgi:hypothetical protein
MALFKGDTTAWEDIQIKLGNFAAREAPSPSNEDKFKETMARAEGITKQDFVDSLFKEEPSVDIDLMALRQARLDQLKRQDQQTCVRRITKESYLDEVTEGSKTAIVMVLMDRGGGDSFMEAECRKIALEWISELAPSKGFSIATRFYVGDIDDLIGPNFPQTSLPFAVVYADGKCQSQMQRATMNGILNAITLTARELTRISKTSTIDQGTGGMDADIRKELAARRNFARGSDDSDSSDADISDDERSYQRSKGYSSINFERNVLRYN